MLPSSRRRSRRDGQGDAEPNFSDDDNLHQPTVVGFGDEWTRFDQRALPSSDRTEVFDQYFSVFPWHLLPASPKGFDLGCGSGRWAAEFASRFPECTLHCIDPSDAIDVARTLHRATVDDIPLDDNSMDFGYSLGVLHHIPDTQAGLVNCVRKLRPGAPFLVYLYYAFDNRPWWFRSVWVLSDRLRRVISLLPHGPRYLVSQVLAFGVYLPLSRLSKLAESLGFDVDHIPLSGYRNRSLYVLRTDALDRFGTRLEQRFTRAEVLNMMQVAGLTNVVFRESPAHWVAVGVRKSAEVAWSS
jgi:SAM-dependent methyltransferase